MGNEQELQKEKEQKCHLSKEMLLWLLVFTLFTNICRGQDGIQYTQFSTTQRHLGGVVTGQSTSVRSKRHCASLCVTINGCMSFLYNAERHACKFVSQQVFISSSPVDEIYSRHYVVDCGFPPYEDGAMVDYTSTIFGAKANYLCVKGYSSSGTRKRVCLCNGTWSETDLVCSPSSHSTWQQVATTKASTTPKNQRHDLIKQIYKTCKPKLRVKFDYKDWSSVTFLSTYGFYSLPGFWGEAVGMFTKSSWDSFEITPQRVFELFVSNAQSTRMSVDNSGSVTKNKYDGNFIWFVKDDQCISNSHSSDTGSVLTSLFEGQVDPDFDTYHADGSNSTVCGQRTVDMSHDAFPTFIAPPYWFVEKECTSGRKNIIRWHVAGGFINTEPRSRTMSWCPDTCWYHVFDTRTSPPNKDKHISHLINGVLHGHNIMIKVANVVAKTREIILQSNHVTVGVKEFWLPADKDAFSSESLRAWMIASTTGRVVQCTHIPESPRGNEIKEEEKHSAWFLDSRQWDKVLEIDGTGTVLSGSRSTLVNKVNEGRSLRVGVLHTNGIYKALEVDTIDVSKTGHIAANIYHNVDLVLGQGNNLYISDTCQAALSIITTEGSYKMYRYNLGAGGNHSVVTSVAKTEWFIEL